jgi:predicted ATPase/DNA-binding winged helix-turn-helix (wHTH) protein
MTQVALRFGPFQLDPPNARLMCGSRAVALQPKAFDVLAYLAEHAGRLVSQEELIDAIWPDTIVGDSSLKTCVRQIRQALGDPARQPQFIETVHRRGYRFIAAIAKADELHVVPAEDVPHPAEPSQPSALFVGRTRELLQLHAWLAQALCGERQIVFVTGGPGSGKTALVEAFEQHAAADGRVWIAGGQCFEQYGSGEAYLPVLEAVGRLARGTGREQLLRLLAAHAPTWLAQLPGLSARLAGDGNGADSPGASPERMLREMAEALEALTAETPLVLVIEDLHWGDYSTLDLVSALARRRQRARLLVLATYRPVEAVLSGHPLRAVKQDLQARRLCHEIPLGLLDERAVADYLDARFPGGGLPSGLARLLHQRTEGNPLFLVTLVDYWLAQGALSARGGSDGQADARWELRTNLEALDVGVPASIRSLIEKQLERLSPDELRILEGASVAGVEFTSAAAAAAAEQDVPAVEEHCDRLVRQHHFLLPKGVGQWPDRTVLARYRFGHELYHRVVYERVPAARRRRLHERLGQRLETAYGTKGDEIAAELALHFEQAHDHARAAAYLGQAADRAARHFAHREAADYLRRALAAVERLPESERADHELRLQVRLGLQLQVTKGFAAPEAQQAYLRARELLRHAPQSSLVFPVLWGLWLFHKVRSELPKAREMAEELHSRAAELGEPALILQSQQAYAVTTLCLGQPSLTRQHMQRATELYDPKRHHGQTFLFGQDPGVACLAFGAVALWLLGYPEQAVATSSEATRLSHELSQPSSQALALHFAAMLHQCRGDSRSALASAELALAIAADQGFSFWHAGGTVFRGWALSHAMVQGSKFNVQGSATLNLEQGTSNAEREAGEGIRLIQEGIQAWADTGSVTYRTYFLALLAEALEKMGRVGDALEALEEAIALAERTSEGLFEAELHRLRGQMLSRLGQAREARKRAREEFDAALQIARRQEARSLELRAAMSLCRCHEEQGKLAAVRPLLQETYDWFTEGFETPDLQAAKKLLKRTGR